MGDRPDEDIEWRDDVPRSRRFDDIYYDPDDGLAESRFVFLNGCDLPSAWHHDQRFVIAETGFGTGLNFLLTWQQWRETRRPHQQLHYLAVEGYPLSRSESARALARWPALEPLSQRLDTAYPVITPGFHRIEFADDGVFLTLMIGDVLDVLVELEARVDAWYLDGFAPSRNPSMWRDQVFEEMARLSRPNAVVATFTAAGFVRRGLQASGFEMTKKPGFGHKRERLVGHFRGPPTASRCDPWSVPDGPQTPRSVALIGGGVAAGCLARSLAQRSIDTRVISAQGPCASDNPWANVMPRLPADDGDIGRLNWSAYLHAITRWARTSEFRPVGALLAVTNERGRKRQDGLHGHWGRAGQIEKLDQHQASDQVGLELPCAGLWFPNAGLVCGRQARPRPASSELIQGHVAALQRAAEGWILQLTDGQILGPFDAAVIAAGPASQALLPQAHLGLCGFAGQISFVQPTERTRSLRSTLISDRYLTPVADGHHILGATFESMALDLEPRVKAVEHQRNLDAFGRHLPALPLGSVIGGWSGLRVTTQDRLPVVGPVVDRDDFITRYSALRRRLLKGQRLPASENHGLYVMAGLGSRGFTHAPLSAELLLARMLGEPWPIERRLARLLDPARFLVRDLKRNRV